MRIHKLIGQSIPFVLLALALSFSVANAGRTGGGSVNYFTGNSDGFSTIYYNSGPVDIGSSASLAATLFVQGYSNINISEFAVASSTGQSIFSVGGPDTLASTTKITQYQGFGTPTVATSSGIGITGQVILAAGSTDLAGNLTVFTGASPAVGGTITTVTFASSTNPVFCIQSPLNSITASGAASTTFMGTTTTGFTFKAVAGLSLTASSIYQWAYHCN